MANGNESRLGAYYWGVPVTGRLLSPRSQVTNKDLADAKERLATAQSNCMQLAADHEATVKSRAEELAAIAQAKKILEDTAAGVVSQTCSLLQVATSSANSEVITMVKKLAKQHHSSALAQLASKIEAVVRYGGQNSDDVFAKVGNGRSIHHVVPGTIGNDRFPWVLQFWGAQKQLTEVV